VGPIWWSGGIWRSVMNRAQEVPRTESCEPAAVISLGSATHLPATSFSKVTPIGGDSWTNTPEGEWSALVAEGEGDELQGSLRLVDWGQCSLLSVSVNRPAMDSLVLRLNFGACMSNGKLVSHVVAVEVGLRRADHDGGSGLLQWMCSLMPPERCKGHDRTAGAELPSRRTSSLRSGSEEHENVDVGEGPRRASEQHTGVLVLHRELGTVGLSAVRWDVVPLADQCFPPLSWVSLGHGAEATLALSSSTWDTLASHLPVASSLTDVDATLKPEHVCVEATSEAAGLCRGGGRGGGGGGSGEFQPWEYLVTMVVSASMAAVATYAVLRGFVRRQPAPSWTPRTPMAGPGGKSTPQSPDAGAVAEAQPAIAEAQPA